MKLLVASAAILQLASGNTVAREESNEVVTPAPKVDKCHLALPSESVNDCIQMCKLDKRCKSYSYSSKYQQCWLKDVEYEKIGHEPKTGILSGDKNGSPYIGVRGT